MFEHLELAASKHPLVAEARAYARAKQESINQVRVGSGDPYHLHTEGAANIIAALVDDPELIAAECLHDDVEDIPDETCAILSTKFGTRSGRLVGEVTNHFTKARYPDLLRAERKKLEVERIAGISPDGKLMKLGDICENTSQPENLPTAFSKVYMVETAQLLAVLRVPGSENHEILYQRAMEQVRRGQSLLRPLPHPTIPSITHGHSR